MGLRFRTPTRCQNGHFRYFHWGGSYGEITNTKWGPKSPDCKCSTFAMGEGFAKCGNDERFIGLTDKCGAEIWEGDIVRWYVNGLTVDAPVYYDEEAACFWMGKDLAGSMGLVVNDWMRGEYEVIGNIHATTLRPPNPTTDSGENHEQ